MVGKVMGIICARQPSHCTQMNSRFLKLSVFSIDLRCILGFQCCQVDIMSRPVSMLFIDSLLFFVPDLCSGPSEFHNRFNTPV